MNIELIIKVVVIIIIFIIDKYIPLFHTKTLL